MADSKESDPRFRGASESETPGFRWEEKELSSGWDDEEEQTQLRVKPLVPATPPPAAPPPVVEDDGSRAVTAVFHQDPPAPYAREASIPNEPKVMFDPRLRVSASALPNARHLLRVVPPDPARSLLAAPIAPGPSSGRAALPLSRSDWPVAMPPARPSSAVRRPGAFGKLAAVAGAAMFVVVVSVGSIAVHKRMKAPASAAATSAPRAPATSVVADLPQGFSVARAPVGTTVIIDGTRREAVPATIRDLTPGVHYLRFEAGERFTSVERTVEIVRGQVAVLDDVVLPLRLGSLTLHIAAKEARVSLRHTKTGRAKRVEGPFPVTIDIPGHGWEVIVDAPGKEPQRREVVFKEGRSATELRFD